ncbi:tRNA 2-thiocytidine(32) synthetase TtcA [Odoribacter sp. OttesenSCG-928-G04]|nr:tRNA 2-thiocytidine(32) synthetase TtcA [Odoribacter sp. OttesenSCG-928-G04]MDL2331182.1 tRNA 2-thiocytidine(32) synthetase TtcA [Odoribacter sp. OttesenSCG-928-A06]
MAGMEGVKREKVFFREFFRKVGKAIFDYEMIDNGDTVLVGVSGGKDSLALLEVLALRGRDKKYDYKVKAAHIAVENVSYEVDEEYVRSFCEKLGVELIHRTIDAGVKEGSKKPACFVCSWNRRKALFEIAKESGCNKLALGHHRDDAIESLLMSMMFNGTIASMPPKLSMFEGTFTLIRPLIYMSNEETSQFAAFREFKKQKKNCPYEQATNRKAVHELIAQMEKLSPHVRGNLFAAMGNVQKEYLL